jgi:pimeloyl-ACP methyl ester carboxylesterase
MSDYKDIWYQSSDDLKLYARDYPRDYPRDYENDEAALTLLCMPGLTRNAADFEDLCIALQGTHRVIAVDQRGRGKSQWDKDASHYQPATYVQDMFTLLDELQLDTVGLVGTSLGGLMAMLMNAMQPGRFAGVILNDIGPVVNQVGLDRIKGYVGKAAPVTTWAQAIGQTRQTNGAAFPLMQAADWERFTRRIYGEDDSGVPRLLYDPAIAQPIAASEDSAVPPDLWPVFETLAGTPTLVIRGELSDILSPDCVAEMKRRKPDMQVFEVADVGHAPVLDEPGLVPAIKAFLAAIPAR